ncbi:hypothetical protein FJ364_01025 [Candidatus Dependentiae bacterium]|nr:hypothetical protein [Candidatus Dependentiae bacterium]
MQFNYVFRFFIILLLPISLVGKEIVLNKIIARVNGKNILKSHLEEARITKGAQPFTLDELITDEVVVQKAEELGCTPSASDLEAAINAEKIEFGGKEMTNEDFERERLQSIGLTLAQYRTQLYRFQATEYLISRLITNKLVIPAQEIEEFYKKNPVHIEEKFHIMLANADSQKQKVDTLRWRDLGWVSKDQLDESYYKAIKSLKAGEWTIKPIKKNGIFIFIKLEDYKPRHLEPLSNCYTEIKQQLKEEQRGPFVKDFVADLKTKAHITFP